MCTWVALVLPSDADHVSIAELSDEYKIARGFQTTEIKWQGDDVIPLEPRSMCFCGTAVASVGARHEDTEHTYLRRVRRDLEKKGWGEAKIARNLDEQRKYLRRKEGETQRMLDDATDDLAEPWAPFLQDVVARRYAGRVGIVAYDAGSPKKWKSLRAVGSLRSGELSSRRLATLAEGDVLTIRP